MKVITYETLLELEKQKQTFVLDIFATWCNPCKVLSSILEQIEKENPKVVIYKFDTDSVDPVVLNSLQQKYNFMSIPCVVFYAEGNAEDIMVGLTNSSYYFETVRKYFP